MYDLSLGLGSSLEMGAFRAARPGFRRGLMALGCTGGGTAGAGAGTGAGLTEASSLVSDSGPSSLGEGTETGTVS